MESRILLELKALHEGAWKIDAKARFGPGKVVHVQLAWWILRRACHGQIHDPRHG